MKLTSEQPEAPYYDVFVNGEVSQDQWVEVDTQAGYGLRYYKDGNGYWTSAGGELLTERVEGKFELRRKNFGGV